jgi:hypothetical protein
VLPGADLDSGPHACMLACARITSLGLKVPAEIDQLAMSRCAMSVWASTEPPRNG